MDKAKRARTAETPKQPSLCLTLRAPYLYPDRPTRPSRRFAAMATTAAIRGEPAVLQRRTGKREGCLVGGRCAKVSPPPLRSEQNFAVFQRVSRQQAIVRGQFEQRHR